MTEICRKIIAYNVHRYPQGPKGLWSSSHLQISITEVSGWLFSFAALVLIAFSDQICLLSDPVMMMRLLFTYFFSVVRWQTLWLG